MPFDLASAKPAAGGGGFDLASAKPVTAATSTAPSEPPEPPDERSTGRRYLDALKAPLDIAKTAVSGMVAAPIANVMGLSAAAFGPPGGDPKGFRDDMQRRLTYNGNNPTVDAMMKVPAAVGEAVSNVAAPIIDEAKGGQANDRPRAMAVNAGLGAAEQALNFAGIKGVPKVGRAIGDSKDLLTGATARGARGEAMTATRDALSGVEAAHGRTQAAKMTEAQVYEDTAVRTQQALDAARQRPGVPTQDVIGSQVRDGYLKVMADAKAAREAAVDPLYAQAKTAAAAKEAAGARVNVAPAVADLDEMLRLSENLPDLQAKLLKLRQSVEAAPTRTGPPAPIGTGKVTSKVTLPRVEAPKSPGLTYEELDLASRYIKDIAFSGEAEGYGALIRNTAKKLSLKLDKQISDFVPEHAAATAKYREMSAPMETLATRIGDALHDTEGGLKGDAYGKVSAQDLPGRIFGKKDRIEQLVDALAGGKTAAPDARAAAQARVDTWVENWILDSKRGKVGSEAAVQAPGTRAALQAAPGAAGRLSGTFEREAADAARIPELKAGADTARVEARAAEGARLKTRQMIEQAELDMRHGSVDAAYKGYVSALRQNMAVADPDRYRAAIALIERASTAEEKTARARKLAMGIAGLAGVAGAAKVGVQIPGAL